MTWHNTTDEINWNDTLAHGHTKNSCEETTTLNIPMSHRPHIYIFTKTGKNPFLNCKDLLRGSKGYMSHYAST